MQSINAIYKMPMDNHKKKKPYKLEKYFLIHTLPDL